MPLKLEFLPGGKKVIWLSFKTVNSIPAGTGSSPSMAPKAAATAQLGIGNTPQTLHAVVLGRGRRRSWNFSSGRTQVYRKTGFSREVYPWINCFPSDTMLLPWTEQNHKPPAT